MGLVSFPDHLSLPGLVGSGTETRVGWARVGTGWCEKLVLRITVRISWAGVGLVSFPDRLSSACIAFFFFFRAGVGWVWDRD